MGRSFLFNFCIDWGYYAWAYPLISVCLIWRYQHTIMKFPVVFFLKSPRQLFTNSSSYCNYHSYFIYESMRQKSMRQKKVWNKRVIVPMLAFIVLMGRWLGRQSQDICCEIHSHLEHWFPRCMLVGHVIWSLRLCAFSWTLNLGWSVGYFNMIRQQLCWTISQVSGSKRGEGSSSFYCWIFKNTGGICTKSGYLAEHTWRKHMKKGNIFSGNIKK